MRHEWPGFPREGERYGVRFDTVVHRQDGTQVNVTVTDCSSHGCQLTGHDFLIGELVTIELPGSDQLNAQIRWTGTAKAGARFVGRVVAP